MGDNLVRLSVRAVLSEMIQQGKAVYGADGGGGMFPMDDDVGITRLPSDIDTSQDYLVNWQGISNNDDLYNFPIEEFKKGLHVEKSNNNIFNILDLAKRVIGNLEQNSNFYTDLGV